MTTNNSVNLEKSSEMPPIKCEYLFSYSKEKLLIVLPENGKNSAIKLSMKGPVLLILVNSSQIFSKELLVVAINKIQSFCYT